MDESEPWKDPEILHQLYREELMSQTEIAEKLGCSQSTLSYWLRKLNIHESENQVLYERMRRSGDISMKTTSQGYIRAEQQYRGEHDFFSMHRLLAVAKYGFDAVARDGAHVHHKNHIPWDNRPANIQLLPAERHSAMHAEERSKNRSEPYTDPETLASLYWKEGLSLRQIADRLNTSNATVERWMDRHGIPTRDKSESAHLHHESRS